VILPVAAKNPTFSLTLGTLFALTSMPWLTSLAHADSQTGEWSFIVAPYAWLAGAGGTIVTDGKETEFDLSFDDILELTTGGFQINVQARRKRFFLVFDGTWATLGQGEDLLGGRLDFKVKQTIAEFRGGYRLIGPEFSTASPEAQAFEPGAVALDAYLGVRYWRTDLSFSVELPGRPPLIPPTQASAASVDEWVEPLIGARFGLGLTPNVGVVVGGNLGGFGIGEAADLTWTLSLFVNWRFAQKWSAAFGWRTQNVNDISGSGADRNGSDITTTGPIVGFVYGF